MSGPDITLIYITNVNATYCYQRPPSVGMPRDALRRRMEIPRATPALPVYRSSVHLCISRSQKALLLHDFQTPVRVSGSVFSLAMHQLAQDTSVGCNLSPLLG